MPFEEMAWRKLLNARDKGAGSGNVVEGQEILQRNQVKSAGDFRVFEKSFEFGAEDDVATGPADVKGLDAKPVAAQHQPLPVF